MMGLGLSSQEQMELNVLLYTSHRVWVQLQILDLNHNFIGDISKSMLSGEVTIDSTSDVQRQLNLVLFDPNRSIQLDPNDPRLGTAYPTRMIRAIYNIGRVDGTKWFSIPVFTGPVNKVDRDGVAISIECLGKEILSNGGMWSSKSYANGWLKIDLIRDLLGNTGGERFMDFINNTSRITANVGIDRADNTVWGYCRWLANTMGLQMFYDGRGYARIRPRPTSPVLTLSSRMMQGDPQIGYDLQNLVNAVEITGGTPRGAKKPLIAKAVADAAHPLSPQSLGRLNGAGVLIPKYYPLIEENADYLTQAAVNSRAQEILNDGLLQAVEVAATCVVIPHFEEDDMIGFQTNKYTGAERIKKVTIPLTVDSGPMSLGYNMNVRPSRLASSLRRA